MPVSSEYFIDVVSAKCQDGGFKHASAVHCKDSNPSPLFLFDLNAQESGIDEPQDGKQSCSWLLRRLLACVIAAILSGFENVCSTPVQIDVSS